MVNVCHMSCLEFGIKLEVCSQSLYLQNSNTANQGFTNIVRKCCSTQMDFHSERLKKIKKNKKYRLCLCVTAILANCV